MQTLFDQVMYTMDIAPFVLSGFSVTAKVYFFTLIFALPIGVICAILKVVGPKPIKHALNLYTWVVRGTPLMLTLFFFVYGLPVVGIKLAPFTGAITAYALTYGAFLTEIFRGGLESIDKGQYEAAKVLGMSYAQTMRYIIIPQTIRRVLPPVCSEAINLVKDTALLAAIGIADMLRIARQVFTRDMNLAAFVLLFALYLLLSSVLVKIFKKLEKKFAIDI